MGLDELRHGRVAALANVGLELWMQACSGDEVGNVEFEWGVDMCEDEEIVEVGNVLWWDEGSARETHGREVDVLHVQGCRACKQVELGGLTGEQTFTCD